MRADDAHGTPTQSQISPSIQVYEEKRAGEVTCVLTSATLSFSVQKGEVPETLDPYPPSKPKPVASVRVSGQGFREISNANTHNSSTWFQSKFLHVDLNITNLDRSV